MLDNDKPVPYHWCQSAIKLVPAVQIILCFRAVYVTLTIENPTCVLAHPRNIRIMVR